MSTNFVPIFAHDDINLIRVMRAALEAHGFNPRPDGAEMSVTFPGVAPLRGKFAIEVPERESRDAQALAEALFADMNHGD